MDEIIKLMEKAKELGIESFENGPLKFKFPQVPPVIIGTTPPLREILAPDENTIKEALKALGPGPEAMTSEEIQYYATPYYDQLQAEKKAREEALKEEQATRTA
jgi:hypothetical protein